jgi:predicted RND superfamily exporter protein
MSSDRELGRAGSYVRWLLDHAPAVLGVVGALLAVSAFLAITGLPLRSNFASLLPDDARSVIDLHRLSKRAPAQGTVITIVTADDPARREKAATAFIDRLKAINGDLIARIESDDKGTREFLRRNLHLLVPLEDLQKARDALEERIKREKLAANPLFVDFEDEDDDEKDKDDDSKPDALDELREQRDELMAKIERSGMVSEDGTAQLIVMRSAFSKGDIDSADLLRDRLEAVRAEVMKDSLFDGVSIGYTGDVITALTQRDGVIRGMAVSASVTALLVAMLLWAYYRSALLVVLLTATLMVGVILTFGLAAIAIGSLNLATAFLGAIVAGNGVNFGLLLLSRYVEERAESELDAAEAMAVAVRSTFKPTIVASLGAAIAYGSLAVTSFPGFSHFAFIGASGMLLCWLAAFTILPIIVVRLDRKKAYPSRSLPWVRSLTGALGTLRRGPVLVLCGLIAVGGAVLAYEYVEADPFEYDVRRLKSNNDGTRESGRWMIMSNKHFGRGISGVTYVAAESSDQVPAIVDALEAIDGDRPEEERVIGVVRSIEDVVPRHQAEKLKILDDIRTMIDEDVAEALEGEERERIIELRPRDDLKELTLQDVPEEIAIKLRERSGRVGLLVSVRPSLNLDVWDGRDLIKFSNAIRKLRLADGSVVTTSGSSVIFADVVSTIRTDGPYATLAAAVLVLVMVFVVVGINRTGAAVVASTALGTLIMVGAAALLGIKVNFLDFVALPITLGVGVDYAVNIAHRNLSDTRAVATSAGGTAVLMCALTTIIAYSSLLVSDNMAVQSFGLASLIGEIACVVVALTLVPALVRRRQS